MAAGLPDAQSQTLAALVERRRQVVGMLTAEKNRLQQALPPVRPKVAEHIAWLERFAQRVGCARSKRLIPQRRPFQVSGNQPPDTVEHPSHSVIPPPRRLLGGSFTLRKAWPLTPSMP